MLKKMMVSWLGLIALILSGCYEPKQAVFRPEIPTSNGNLIYLNPHDTRKDAQVCNVSATQDPDNYPNSILFLNFPQSLNCRRGDTTNMPLYMRPESYKFGSHDHLFIVDTSNTLLWYFELPDPPYLSMQDPEWSNHPNYISFLCEAEGSSYYGYVVKVLGKDILQWYAGGLDATADPFVSVDSSILMDTSSKSGLEYDPNLTTVDKIIDYFATTHIKFVYLKKLPGEGSHSIYCADYRYIQNGKPGVFKLERPAGLDGWEIEAPIVSPNGKWVAYQIRSPGDIFKAYVQELIPGSKPIFFADGGEPHFWKREDGTLYIVYTDHAGLISDKIDFLSIPYGSIGQTFLQEVRLFSTGPASLHFSKIGEPFVVCPYPMKGGMSRDGTIIGTGYSTPYIWVNK